MKNINIQIFSHGLPPIESTTGGTLSYIADHLIYQTRNDLNIYLKYYLESTFIEVTNLSKTYIIVGCTYRHPTVDLNAFKLLLS